MSDTPRTDALHRAYVMSNTSPEYVRQVQSWTDFASELERENARLRDAITKIRIARINEDGTAKTELALDDAIDEAGKI